MRPLTQREIRSLALLGVAIVITVAVVYWPQQQTAVAAVSSVPAAERRLTHLRELAAAAPGRLQLRDQIAAELKNREAALLVADTAPQAQAQLLQVIRRTAQIQQPPLEIRGSEFSQPRRYQEAYAELSVTVTVEAGIEQILNFLADLSNQPEYLTTTAVNLTSTNHKRKLVPARITVSTLLPARLAPARKEGAL